MKSYKLSALFVLIMLLQGVTACGGDPDVQVGMKLLSSDQYMALPPSVEGSVYRIEFEAWRGSKLVWKSSQDYDGPDGGATLPGIPYGDDIMLVAQAYADGRDPLASGASPRLSLSPSSRSSFFTIPMTLAEAFTKAFTYDFDTDGSTAFDLPSGARVGAVAAEIPNAGVLYIGGTGAGDVGGTPFGVNMNRNLEVYDSATGELIPLADDYSCGAQVGDRDAVQLEVPRIFHSVTTLPDGRIVVAGGFTSQGGNLVATNTVEVITITDAANFCGEVELLDEGLYNARGGHTAVIVGPDEGRSVNDTRLFFVGGASGTLTADGSQLNTDKAKRVEELWIPGNSREQMAVDETELEIEFGRAFHSTVWVDQQELGMLLIGGVEVKDGQLQLVSAIENVYEDRGPGSELGSGFFADTAELTRVGHYVGVIPAPNPLHYPDIMVIGGYGAFADSGASLFSGTPAADVIRITPAVRREGNDSTFVIDSDLAATLPSEAASAWGSGLRASISGDLVWAGGLNAEGEATGSGVRLFVERDGSLDHDGAVDMSSPRAFSAPIELTSHLLLFAGGASGSSALRDADFYNPADYRMLSRMR